MTSWNPTSVSNWTENRSTKPKPRGRIPPTVCGYGARTEEAQLGEVMARNAAGWEKLIPDWEGRTDDEIAHAIGEISAGKPVTPVAELRGEKPKPEPKPPAERKPWVNVWAVRADGTVMPPAERLAASLKNLGL